MRAVGANSLALCFFVIAELRRGAHLAMLKDESKAARLNKWIDKVLSVDFQFADSTPQAADLYAAMTTVSDLNNLRISHPTQKKDKLGHDLMIAALSIAHRMPIATSNIRDFLSINRHFKLPGLFDPVQSEWHVEPLPCLQSRPRPQAGGRIEQLFSPF
ncbi:PIN domain nuclease [Mesorhizobium soli]|uniref:PIN domain nuclease n=2 Tax=Pseudaminobacter soli (ex Li et al. 2025) TaxID=1295366 RepID=A0A2P7SD38_9HYPH|nr:PIN domain nuclease [Mesorhizobium soli]